MFEELWADLNKPWDHLNRKDKELEDQVWFKGCSFLVAYLKPVSPTGTPLDKITKSASFRLNILGGDEQKTLATFDLEGPLKKAQLTADIHIMEVILAGATTITGRETAFMIPRKGELRVRQLITTDNGFERAVLMAVGVDGIIYRYRDDQTWVPISMKISTD